VRRALLERVHHPPLAQPPVPGHLDGSCPLGVDVQRRSHPQGCDFLRKGTITFVITIPLVGAGGERWTIASGTKAYSKLHGRGYEAVDDWVDSPATFVLKGTVFQAR
jgi:hypothetical protein